MIGNIVTKGNSKTGCHSDRYEVGRGGGPLFHDHRPPHPCLCNCKGAVSQEIPAMIRRLPPIIM